MRSFPASPAAACRQQRLRLLRQRHPLAPGVSVVRHPRRLRAPPRGRISRPARNSLLRAQEAGRLCQGGSPVRPSLPVSPPEGRVGSPGPAPGFRAPRQPRPLRIHRR